MVAIGIEHRWVCNKIKMIGMGIEQKPFLPDGLRIDRLDPN